MPNTLTTQQLFELLPHRYPFLLVDTVIDYKIGDYLRAIKCVTINEPFFAGHFPHNPVMPGVLILEALAQASVILANLELTVSERKTKIHLFAGIDEARFKRVVYPGDQLLLEVSALKNKRGIWKMQAQASVENEIACSAILISAQKEINGD